MDSGQLRVDNIDVFCERGVFDVDQTRRILSAGQTAGLAANFHAEELHCLHSAEVSYSVSKLGLTTVSLICCQGQWFMHGYNHDSTSIFHGRSSDVLLLVKGHSWSQ